MYIKRRLSLMCECSAPAPKCMSVQVEMAKRYIYVRACTCNKGQQRHKGINV